jgi:hypothetical protein
MFPLIVILIGLGVTALAVTWYAVVSAVDGYEDDSGFYPAPRDSKRRSQPEIREIEPVGTKEESEARPCFPVR